MSELLPIWNSTQLAGGVSSLPPFTIPNNPNAKTLKINNQSRYWLLITKTQTSVNVDRIEPFSYLIMPYEADIALAIDTSEAAESSLNPDLEFVDYSAIAGTIQYIKGSTQFSGSSSVTINGGVTISNSQLDVSVSSMPNVVVEGGTLDVGSATIINEQLPVSYVYNDSKAFTVPAGTYSGGQNVQFVYQFLKNGTMANVHHVDFYIVSAQGWSYQIISASGFVKFVDGKEWNANSTWGLTNNAPSSYSAEGQAVICNEIQFVVTPIGTSSLATDDTITVYFAIDSNETSIGTKKGVPIDNYSSQLTNASGTCMATGSNRQQVLGYNAGRRYLFFQNLSGYDMYIGFGATTGLPTVGGAGSILVPSGGGAFTMEGFFCSEDYLFVTSSTSGGIYTCLWY